jgi:PAS domain S-box-containing protein
LSQNFFQYNLGIDQFFITDPELKADGNFYPGRMAPITAICFAQISFALLTIDSRKKKLLILDQYLLHLSTLLSFTALLGYLFQVRGFYHFSFVTSIAFQTAISIFFLSIAASLLNPDLGVTGLFTGEPLGNKLAKKFFLQMIFTVLIISYVLFISVKTQLVGIGFGVAFYTLTVILICLFLILRMSNVLNKNDLERTKAEENLFSVAMFLDMTPDPIMIIDDKGNVQIINNQTETVFGYDRNELIGKPVNILLPSYAEKKNNKNRGLFFNLHTIPEIGISIEVMAKKKNGEQLPVEISLSPFKIEKITWVSASIRDITNRKEEERKLSQLATIIESSADAIISKNLNGNVLTWNKGAEKLLGYPFEEAFGKHISFLIPPELIKEESSLMEKILTGESVDQYETIRIRKDGTRINASITLSPIKDKYNKIVGVSKILRDITKNKEAEEKLRKYAILESKSKEMEQFAYIASHDLREPLLTIKNYMKLFVKDYGKDFNEESQQYIDAVIQASNRMDTLIRNLLDYSRLSQLKKLELTNLNTLINEVIEDLNAVIRKTDAKITIEPLPTIKVYPVEFKLLFQNLITNAIKFRKKDLSPEIHISASKTGPIWQFQVSDNGIGIADEDKEKVFLMFKRLHSRSEYEGTGIGLAHCKKIVELHNGTIGIESQPKKGSTFKFSILT